MPICRKPSERGNATIEFALVFLPLTLLMLGVVEIARIGWMHQTLAMSVKTIARQAVVHGEKCVEITPECARSIGSWVSQISSTAVGMDPASLQLTFASGSTTRTCAPATSCTNDGTVWPPPADNGVGLPITIRGTYAIAPFYWFSRNSSNGSWILTTAAQEVIQF